VPTLALTTNKAVADIPLSAKGQVTWYCTELTGFCVRAGTTSKTFYLWRRVAGRGQATFIRLGRVGQITLQKARQDAQQLIGDMVGGTNPVERKRDVTADGMTLQEAWQLTRSEMKKKGRSRATFDDYESKLKHLADWLDQPLVAITRPVCRKLHTGIGENHGTYMANGVMRVLRLIWRRVRRQRHRHGCAADGDESAPQHGHEHVRRAFARDPRNPEHPTQGVPAEIHGQWRDERQADKRAHDQSGGRMAEKGDHGEPPLQRSVGGSPGQGPVPKATHCTGLPGIWDQGNAAHV
jgi:hypothetical protein